MTQIPFNKPFIAGKELYYIAQAVTFGNIGGDGEFTRSCARTLEQRLSIAKVLLPPSCTAALEMAAIFFGQSWLAVDVDQDNPNFAVVRHGELI